MVSPNNKGSSIALKYCYTLVHTVCVALRCAVLPEIIIAFKAEINKTCSVSSHIYTIAIATFNCLKITGENDCMQVPIHFISS